MTLLEMSRQYTADAEVFAQRIRQLQRQADAEPDPEKRQQTGCQVVLRDKAGNAVREMMLGKVHYSVGEQIGRYRTNIPDGRYVRIMLKEKPHYFLMSNPMSTCTPLSAFWYNPVVCPNMGMPILIRYTDLANKKILWEVRLDQDRHTLAIPKEKGRRLLSPSCFPLRAILKS